MAETLIAGRYRLDELLGHGGMSEVWCATDLELERRVALKLLAPHADTARFEREARAVALLGHPHITELYDYGRAADGRPYMVLEYLPGGTLEQRLHDGVPLPDDEVRRISAELASGLAHAHSRDVVHRDLKPANVLFDGEGRAKLADFGLARIAAGEGALTEAGTVLGTAAYISPEQAAGAPATASSDVYSFGVMLYRMLTGRLPFVSDDPLQLVQLHRAADPPPVSELRPDAPPLLESAAMAALEKDPADRPRDGTALLAALGATGTAPADAGTTRILPAAAIPAAPPPPEAPRRRSLVPVTVAALAVLALAGAGAAYELTRPARGSTPPASTQTFTLPKTATHPKTTPTTTATPATTRATTTQATTRAATTRATTTRAPATTAPPPATTTPPPPPVTTVPPVTTDTTPTDTTPTTTAPPGTTTAP